MYRRYSYFALFLQIIAGMLRVDDQYIVIIPVTTNLHAMIVPSDPARRCRSANTEMDKLCYLRWLCGKGRRGDRRGGTAHDSAGVNEFNFMLVKNNQDVRKFKSYLWLLGLNILDTFTHKQQFSRLGRKDQVLRECVDRTSISP